jgi:hypothetical protein
MGIPVLRSLNREEMIRQFLIFASFTLYVHGRLDKHYIAGLPIETIMARIDHQPFHPLVEF